MVNYRLQQIRDELSRRFDLVWSFQVVTKPDLMGDYSNRDDFFLEVASFVEFLLTCPEIAPEFRRLIALPNDIEGADYIQKYINSQLDLLARLAGTVEEVRVSGEFKNSIPYDQNVEQWAKCDFKGIDSRQKLDEVRNQFRLFFDPLPDPVKARVSEKMEWGPSDRDRSADTRYVIDARVKSLLHHHAASSAQVLLSVYNELNAFASPNSDGLSQVGDPWQLRFLQRMFKAGGKSPILHDVEEVCLHCKRVYFAVLNALDSRQVKSAVITRMKQYFEWFKREELFKAAERVKQSKEEKLQRFVEEFVFQAGYFPFVHFRAGRAVPDILSQSTEGDSILIELKQALGKKINDSQFGSFVAQAQSYTSTVRAHPPFAGAEVFLVIFHDGDRPLVLSHEAEQELGRERLYVEFIYLGKKTPSKLKAPLSLSLGSRRTKGKG